MGIKWKKCKVIVSILTFVIGISLFLTSLSLLSKLYKNNVPIKDIFKKDYQDTKAFQQSISQYLESCIEMVLGKPIEQGWNEYENYNSDIANNLHEYLKDDKNLLYKIIYNREVVFDNIDDLQLNGKKQIIPEGYNFLLYFNGSTIRIIKDGKEIQQNRNNWYISKYTSFDTEELKYIDISIAAAKTPKYYSKWQKDISNELYYLQKNREEIRNQYLKSGKILIISIIFLAISFVLRKEKRYVDKRIAGITKKFWYESKIFILLFLLITLVWTLNPDKESIIESSKSFYADRRVTYDYIIPEIFYKFNFFGNTWNIIFIFWIVYIFINDLRYNKKVWKNSLIKKIYSVCQTRYFGFPFEKRILKYQITQFFLQLFCFIIIIILFIYYQNKEGSYNQLIGLCIFSIVLLLFFTILQFSFMKSNKSILADMGKLINQIEFMYNGKFNQSIENITDKDILNAAKNLNGIQQGMNIAIEEQMKSERMKVELISNVSHDIKTPLTSIISYVELLKQEKELPDYIKEYIQILDTKSERLKEMVQDVFEISKAASGQLPVQIEKLDLGKLLRQTLADMEEKIEQSNLIIRTDIPIEEILIMADGQRLYRVFQNLLTNALNYSLDGSRVYVTLSTDGVVAVASIKNISKDELSDNIDFTERFTRGDKSRTDGGSGLGLSIAKSFTEACKGKFKVEHIADLFVVTVEFNILEEESTKEVES